MPPGLPPGNPDKGLWILTEDEHDKLAAHAWYNYQISRNPVPLKTVWGNVPQEEKIAWMNAVAGVLFSLSDKHGLDAVVIDY